MSQYWQFSSNAVKLNTEKRYILLELPMKSVQVETMILQLLRSMHQGIFFIFWRKNYFFLMETAFPETVAAILISLYDWLPLYKIF